MVDERARARREREATVTAIEYLRVLLPDGRIHRVRSGRYVTLCGEERLTNGDVVEEGDLVVGGEVVEPRACPHCDLLYAFSPRTIEEQERRRSETTTFEEFRSRRERERAASEAGRATWRRVSDLTGGGYSGYGAGGRLVYVLRSDAYSEDGPWVFGTVGEGGVRIAVGRRKTLAAAKLAAAALLRPAGPGS